MTNKLLVQNPWNDPFANKIGLVDMYIESSIAEILQLRAESEPGTKLNCPNPLYLKYNELLRCCLKTKDRKNFTKLLEFIETDILKRDIVIKVGAGAGADIRILDTIEEAMGWLANHINLQD